MGPLTRDDHMSPPTRRSNEKNFIFSRVETEEAYTHNLLPSVTCRAYTKRTKYN